MWKVTRDPLDVLQYKVDRMLGRVAEPIPAYDKLKLFIYDGHDTQAVLMLKWLAATNLEYPQPTDYAT